MNYTIFKLSDQQSYAVSINHVIEVFFAGDIIPVPGSDESIVGMAQIRKEALLVRSPHIAIAHIDKMESLEQKLWLVIELKGVKMILLISMIEGVFYINDSDWEENTMESNVISAVMNHEIGIIQKLSLDELLK